MDIDYRPIRPLNKNDKWSEILMGKYLKTKNGNYSYLVLGFNFITIKVSLEIGNYSLEELFNDFTYINGDIIGVKMNSEYDAKCKRNECNNISCKNHSNKYGYICDDCLKELYTSHLSIEEFLSSSKRLFNQNLEKRKNSINEEFIRGE
jgi:hypothetical protein